MSKNAEEKLSRAQKRLRRQQEKAFRDAMFQAREDGRLPSDKKMLEKWRIGPHVKGEGKRVGKL